MKTTLMAVALFIAATAANAQTDYNEVVNSREPLNGFIVNPCNGEPIVYTGECHLVAHQRDDAKGVHYDAHMNCQAVGEGALGNEYVVSVTSTYRSDTPFTCGYTQQLRETSRFISSKPTLNFFLNVNFAVATDQHCNVHVVTDETDVECKGRGNLFF